MKSEQFLANAERCSKLAEATEHGGHKAVYLNMEACWRALSVTAGLSEEGAGLASLRDQLTEDRDRTG
jgi:hypothetical protein